jgi:dCTP deaminase
MSGILSDCAIKKAVRDGLITIDPYNEEQINPASYDLTLGDQVLMYTGISHPTMPGSWRELDVKHEPTTVTMTVDSRVGIVLLPSHGYLMHTRETIWTERYVPIIDGKSSIGRLFVQIHATAGYGDPGFKGQYTLEVIVQYPVRVYPGMRIGQIRFHTIDGVVEKSYTGNYVNERACGPVASQAWRQFQKRK